MQTKNLYLLSNCCLLVGISPTVTEMGMAFPETKLPPPWIKSRSGDKKRIRKAIEDHLRSNNVHYSIKCLYAEWPLHRKPTKYSYLFTVDVGEKFDVVKEGKETLKLLKRLFPRAKCQMCRSSETELHWAVEVELKYFV